jgi:hypothetical protein
MEVQINDRKQEVEYLRMALNMCELGINYTQADLILRVQEGIKKYGGNFSLQAGMDINARWKNYWRAYFDDIQRAEIK